jgi:hypothetical protein
VHLLLQPRRGEQEGAEDLASREEAEAYQVARLIRERVQRADLPVEDQEGVVRPAGFADFAVLLRSTANQVHFERMFRHFDLPYTTPNVRGLFLEAPANDLYQLLRLALYPEDRPAYAGFLRSRWSQPSGPPGPAAFPAAGLPRSETWARGPGPEPSEGGLVGFVACRPDRARGLLHRLWYDQGTAITCWPTRAPTAT